MSILGGPISRDMPGSPVLGPMMEFVKQGLLRMALERLLRNQDLVGVGGVEETIDLLAIESEVVHHDDDRSTSPSKIGEIVSVEEGFAWHSPGRQPLSCPIHRRIRGRRAGEALAGDPQAEDASQRVPEVEAVLGSGALDRVLVAAEGWASGGRRCGGREGSVRIAGGGRHEAHASGGTQEAGQCPRVGLGGIWGQAFERSFESFEGSNAGRTAPARSPGARALACRDRLG